MSQSNNNYRYDAVGNLLRDVSEGTEMTWDVYGKLREVTGVPEGGVVSYTYDVQGNRLSKVRGGEFADDYYVRDAQGNIIALYKTDYSYWDSALVNRLVEFNIYGSSRLGSIQANRIIHHSYDPNDTITPYSDRLKKRYELGNHLGNVLTVLSDKKMGDDSDTDEVVNEYGSKAISRADYYPFGMNMPGRTNTFDYKFGFNGEEIDGSINSLTHYDYGFRIYNPVIGRFLSVDPLTKGYPWYTPYQFAGNTPIEASDIDGLEPSHTAVVSPAEGKKEEKLEDGDYFSDVQYQTYTAKFSGISQQQFTEIIEKLSVDPGEIINNVRAQYRLVDRDGSYGVTQDDHFDITITGGPDGFVVVKDAKMIENYFMVKVQTLAGHPDAGTNTFTLTFDPKNNVATWQTHNVSRTNDNLTGVIASAFKARSKQQKQWMDVAKKVHAAFGFPHVVSATAQIDEFDYNDARNEVGKKESNQSFSRDFRNDLNKRD